jgi:hypothetical protein
VLLIASLVVAILFLVAQELVCIELSNFLTRERYFRFFEKHKHFFSKDSTIYTFVSFVEGLINDLRDSKGYECI